MTDERSGRVTDEPFKSRASGFHGHRSSSLLVGVARTTSQGDHGRPMVWTIVAVLLRLAVTMVDMTGAQDDGQPTARGMPGDDPVWDGGFGTCCSYSSANAGWCVADGACEPCIG
eukprot:COSAG06_NODE_18746_length_871_cov_0.759067_2_plen_114_part_01